MTTYPSISCCIVNKNMTKEERDLPYVVVGNIPSKFHSVDLRSFFSQFIETGKFNCFHFRHRPEILKRKDEASLDQESLSLKGKTTCCVVRLKEEYVRELLEVYNGQNWVDKNGILHPLKVIISRINIKDQGSSQVESYQTRKEKRDHKRETVEFLKEDLVKLSEFFPPSFMPNGNVGTSLNVFKDLIRTCQLPPQVIRKLGLCFPSGCSNRRYGNVGYNYDTENKIGTVWLCADNTNNHENKSRSIQSIENENLGNALHSQKGDFKPSVYTSEKDGDAETSFSQEVETKENKSSDNESEPEEDWERHEALHDDVDCQARTKERLFENKIELKWEKGGSGLVFYTDAAYWDSLNGDFDEQTADDWDIDMGVYEKGGNGDRNSRALLQMRVEEQLWSGINNVDEDLCSKKIGEFEKHTKGFGGNLMKKQGWEEGTSLGLSQPGITEPVPNEGQHPYCKRGLGYYGEKLERHVKRQRVDKDVVISTVFDNPAEEEVSTPLQSAGPYTLKYLSKVEFVPEKRSHFKTGKT